MDNNMMHFKSVANPRLYAVCTVADSWGWGKDEKWTNIVGKDASMINPW